MKLSIVLAFLVAAPALCAADLRPATLQTFNAYVRQAEVRINREQQSPRTFLRLDSISPAERAAREARLHQGEVLIDRVEVRNVEGGMIHHWTGTVLIPHTRLADVLSIVHDYKHLPRHYGPKVVGSWQFWHQGNDYRIRMRTREHKAITVVLDVDYDVRDGSPVPGYWYSTSHSTRVAELEDVGTARERELPPGEEHGFLWAMNTYWRFVQTGDAVIVQCEAISLSRNIPTGLGWLIGPYVQSVPRESLEFTMTATRNAVLRQNNSQRYR